MEDSSEHVQIRQEHPFRPGMIIGKKFVLLRLVAEGAMGAIYEARDTFVGRTIAIKLLHPEYAGNSEILRRFRREAQAMARIQHPNVPMVLEMGQRRDGSFFIVQELLTGSSLRDYIAERGRLGVDETIEILLPLIGALCAAHMNGVIHRDVKPENIVLTRSASGEITPKLVDFGVAKLHSAEDAKLQTQAGTLWGTPLYMSPEQANGSHAIDARSDVWAIGVVLFELLVGSRPFDGPTLQSILTKILSQPAPIAEAHAAGVPEPLTKIIARALERDLSLRIPSMQALRDELVAFASEGHRPPSRLLTGKISPAGEHFPTISSAPGDEVWLSPEDLIPIDDDPASSGGKWPLIQPAPQSRRLPADYSGVDWSHDRPSVQVPMQHEHADAAGLALSVNKLSEAVAHAELAIQSVPSDSDLLGRMRLVQAIAYRWLGDYISAERCALEAAERLPPGSGSWYSALGYVATASGYMGKVEPLWLILDDIRDLAVTPARVNAHTILLCRLAIFLVRAGYPTEADGILQSAQDLARDRRAFDAILGAWFDAAFAELAGHEGDPETLLRRRASAVEHFTSAGDLRNACLQMVNVGNAYMQLGAYRRAVLVLDEALRIAEPMDLDFVPPAKVNLGFALAHIGRLDEALKVESAALERCIQQGHKRFEGAAWIYLAIIRVQRGELDEAWGAADRARMALNGHPGPRAYALAVSASVLLMQRQPKTALMCTREATGLMNKLGGVEEGESLIRVTHALALLCNGDEPEGRKQIIVARERLLERANRIKDPQWRQSYVEGVPDNARVFHLAEQWARKDWEEVEPTKVMKRPW